MSSEDGGIVDERLLTETGSGGLLSDGYLADRPLESYLDAAERPRLVFPSEGRGLVREVDGAERSYTPGSGYRVLVAVTGRRVLVVVGDEGGDRSFELPLPAVADVESDAGFRHSAVTLRTEAGDVWRLFPAGLDAADVRSAVEAIAAAWSRFERQLSDAERAIADAADARADGDIDAGAEARERAETALSAAAAVPERIDGVAAMRRRLESVRADCRGERRRLERERARTARARGRRRWREEAYERAADHLQRAGERLESVLEGDLAPGMERSVREDLAAVERDLRRLSGAPLCRALAVERAAERSDDPMEVIDRFRDAYDSFRTVLELDWGREPCRFDGERRVVRDHLERAVTGRLAARRRAADRQCRAAEHLAAAGRIDGAREAYGTALAHLETAVATARRLAPGRVDPLREQISTVEDRMDALDERVGSGDAAVDRTDEGDSTPAGVPAEKDDTGGEPDRTVGIERGERPTDGVTPREATNGERDPPGGSSPTTTRQLPAGEVTGSPELPERGTSVGGDVVETDTSVTTPAGAETDLDRFLSHLRRLDDDRAIETVGDIWRALGWSVDRREGDTIDAVATRPDVASPVALSVRRRGTPLAAAAVRRLETATEERSADLTPVLVTTDPVEPSAFEAAMVRGMTLVDGARLDELARSTDVRAPEDTGDSRG